VYTILITSSGKDHLITRLTKMKIIKRNRDECGRILTWSVELISGYWVEYNTLKEARVMAKEV
jgi:hypothetical protein